MKQRIGERGFTMIEVLVAIVVLTMVIGSILLMFSNAIGGVWSAGHRSVALDAAATLMADRVGTSTGSGDDELVIVFDGIGPIEVPGSLEEVTGISQGRSVTITAFVPERP
jgi:prepilin-type N-terminal cleavage/methylation domain-containing protein